MIKNIFNKISGNVVVFANLWGQHRIPYLPDEKLRALRDARLKEIVKYAAETVPYYQNLFQTEKIDPHEIRSVKDLDCLPLIDREIVRKDTTQFVSSSRKGKRGVPFITSGTTGSPLTIWHDQYSLLSYIAFREREREVVSRICGKAFGLRVVRIGYPESTVKKVRDFYNRSIFIPIRQELLTLLCY